MSCVLRTPSGSYLLGSISRSAFGAQTNDWVVGVAMLAAAFIASVQTLVNFRFQIGVLISIPSKLPPLHQSFQVQLLVKKATLVEPAALPRCQISTHHRQLPNSFFQLQAEEYQSLALSTNLPRKGPPQQRNFPQNQCPMAENQDRNITSETGFLL